MKPRNINAQPTTDLRLRASVLPQLPARLRRLMHLAYSAYGRAESMTLKDWRDLELQINRRLENEYKQCQQ